MPCYLYPSVSRPAILRVRHFSQPLVMVVCTTLYAAGCTGEDASATAVVSNTTTNVTEKRSAFGRISLTRKTSADRRQSSGSKSERKASLGEFTLTFLRIY